MSRRVVPWELWSQRPEPEQPWRLVGSYPERGLAEDEARSPLPRPVAGTAYRIARAGSDRTLALAVVNRHGEVVDAPPRPGTTSELDVNERQPAGPGIAWYDTWEGPEALGRWMLDRCGGVPRPELVLAACAVVRGTEGLWVPGEDRPRLALEAAEAWAWAGGLGDMGPLRAAAEASRRAGMAPTGGTPAQAVAASWVGLAAYHAATCAFVTRAGLAASGAANATALALRDGSGRVPGVYERSSRAQAAVVRRWIPLGAVLLAHLPSD